MSVRFLWSMRLASFLLLLFLLSGQAQAASPLLYVTNRITGTVIIVDPASNAIIGRVPVGPDPEDIAVQPGSDLLYVSHPDTGIISVLQGTMLRSYCRVGGRPVSIAVTAKGQLYISDPSRDVVAIWDAEHCSKMAEIPVGKSPAGLAIAAREHRVFVADRGADSISVIDMDRARVIATLAAGKAPCAIDMAPDGDRLYVANAGSGDVSVLDSLDLDTLATIGVSQGLDAIIVYPKSRYVMASDSRKGTVNIIQASDNRLVQIAKIAGKPSRLAILPDGSKIYVIDAATGALVILDGESGEALRQIKLPAGSTGIAIATPNKPAARQED